MFANPFQALNSFFDHNNATRAASENYLKELALSSPHDSLDFYISALDIDNLKLVELAAVSIKKYHLEKSEYYDQIDESKFEFLVEKIFALLKQNNKTLKIYKRFIEILVLIYANNQRTFSRLTKNILDMQNTQSHIIKICIMYFIENMCIHDFDEEDLQAIAPELTTVFDNFMQSTDKEVVIATIKAISSFLSNIEDRQISDQFKQIIPIILKLLIATAQESDDDTTITLVQALGELAESHPPLVKPFIEETLEVLSEILITKKFSNNLRNQAIICIQILSRFCDVAVRRSQNLQAKIVPAYIQVLCEIDQQKSDGIFNDMEFSVISKSEPCFVIQESLTKIASALTPKVLFPYFMPFIIQNIQGNVWSAVYASYICIGALAQGSSRFFMNELDQLMNYILSGFNSTDPRITYISLVTVGILALEYSPNLQVNFHKPIIEKIIDVINNKTHIKLQVQALKTFLDFCKDILDEESQDIFVPYGETLLSSLVNIIKNTFHTNSDILLQEALNAVSVLSSLLDQDFAQYYLDVLDILKEILASIAKTNERRAQIRVETIECFGSMINTIRAESGFLSETDKIMEYFIKLAQELDPTDLEHSAILDVYCQVSSYLRYDFVKYMPYIFEDILRLMEMEVELIPDKQPQQGEAQAYGLDISALTMKVSAINAIFVLSRNLGKSYYDYIKPSIKIITKYFSHYSGTISRKAFKTVKNLVWACENEQDVAGVLAECLPSILEVLTTNVRLIHDVAKSKFVLKQIYKSIQVLTGPLLQRELVVNLLTLMIDAVKLCQSENAELAARFEGLDDCDHEKQEEFQEDYNKNCEILRVITQINEVLLKCFGPEVQTDEQTELVKQYFTILTHQNASITEVQYSIEFFNVFLKLCSLNAFNNLSSEIVIHLIACCEKPIFKVIKKDILSGFGVMAKRMDKTNFKTIKSTLLTVILQIIDDPKAFSSENASCTDVAITALGKIALYQYDLQDPQSEEILSRFLKPLPLKDNYSEAQACHRMLLEEISNKNEFLTIQGQNLQTKLLQTIQIIKKVDDSSPEDEILDDFSRKLIIDILNNV